MHPDGHQSRQYCLDPTCGSGTTAYVAEQWGRRWITIDTSRVALAGTRLMAARYPWYLLADSREGGAKEADLQKRTLPDAPGHNDIRQGFVYERVPHIMLSSIASNPLIDDICEKWQAVLEPLRAALNKATKKNWEEWSLDADSTVERMGRICYRTSQQIRRAADRLLPTVLRDSDGMEDERRGIVSVFAGPPPEVKSFPTIAAEAESVRQVVATWLGEGIAAHEIGLFVRTPQLVVRARAAIDGLAGASEMVTAQMSLAKGLEFRAVVVMACDEGVLPLDDRVADAADEAELDDIYETERRLLYVACTRAREHLLLTGVTPVSEYLADLETNAG
jgi:UvrD-like helicase C-terminal domain